MPIRNRLNASSHSETVSVGIDLGTKSVCACVIDKEQVHIIPSGEGNSRTPCYFSTWADDVTGNWYHEIGMNSKIATLEGIPPFPFNGRPEEIPIKKIPPKFGSFWEPEANGSPPDVNMNFSSAPTPKKTKKISPVYNIKQIMGRSFSDPETRKILEQNSGQGAPFKIGGDKGMVQIEAEDVLWKEQGQKYFPQQLSAMLLQHVKLNAERFLGNHREVNEAVITVPSRFSWFQRLATKDAAVMAGFDVVHIVNEATAATIAYLNTEIPPKKKENILVFDLGSNSLDLTLLLVEGIKIQTKCVGGDRSFGGDAFTEALMNYCVQEFKLRHRLSSPQNSNRDAENPFKRLKLEALKERCNWVKEDLSGLLARKIRSAWKNKDLLATLLSKEELAEFLRNPDHVTLLSKDELASLVVKQARSILAKNESESVMLITADFGKILIKKVRRALLRNDPQLRRVVRDVKVHQFHESIDLDVEISLPLFMKLNKYNFQKCLQILNNFLLDSQVQIEQKEIERIILVGASTQFPMLEELLQDNFPQVPVFNSLNPQFVVAYGAALQANNMRFIEDNNLPSNTEILSQVTRVPAGYSIPFSIGIHLAEAGEVQRIGGDFGVIIPSHTQLPCSLYKDFFIPVNKAGISIVKIFVGESPSVLDNTRWASFSVTNLPWNRTGRCKVGFTMEVTDVGMLRVSTYCWNNKSTREGTIVDAFHGRAMKANFIHLLKQDFQPAVINLTDS